MSTNKNLQKAKKQKYDEYYTLYDDVKEELDCYQAQLYGKIVYCNCDNLDSSFWKYFYNNFKKLGLKKLIATYQSTTDNGVYAYEYTGINKDGTNSFKAYKLQGNGDFKSDECIDLLKQADIICTNPPFSLFKDFMKLLLTYNKNFIIIGNINAITYNELFPYFRDDKIWLGMRPIYKTMYFKIPLEKQEWLKRNRKNGAFYKKNEEEILGRIANACWFTNLDNERKHRVFNSTVSIYNTTNFFDNPYPKYDNYRAINVNRIKEIPMDYDGVMGVPITFIASYNPDQFKIIGTDETEGKGLSNGLFIENSTHKQCYVNGKPIYKRIFIIKNKKENEYEKEKL